MYIVIIYLIDTIHLNSNSLLQIIGQLRLRGGRLQALVAFVILKLFVDDSEMDSVKEENLLKNQRSCNFFKEDKFI